MGVIIAIDGPAGSGKGTMAKVIAEQRGFLYVDTGALYRTVALKCMKENVASTDLEGIKKVLEILNPEIISENGNFTVIMDGVNVSEEIREHSVSEFVPNIAKLDFVRESILHIQRGITKNHNIVIEGRDICTEVFPNAEVQIFLTASLEVRAQRRYEQDIAAGRNVTYEEIYENLKERDIKDSTREIAPLKVAPTAVVIDTSNLSLEQSMDAINVVIESKIGHKYYGPEVEGKKVAFSI